MSRSPSSPLSPILPTQPNSVLNPALRTPKKLDIDALQSKLNALAALVDGGTPPRTLLRTPLASTCSETCQYEYQEALRERQRKPYVVTEADKIRAAKSLQEWNEMERREREAKYKQDCEALGNIQENTWRVCGEYEAEALRVTALRAAEDISRKTSAEGHETTWTENDQRALEFQRKKEDYRQLADRMAIFLDCDEESEGEMVLSWRVQQLKILLQLYDSQWHESFNRLREDTEKRGQQMLDLAEMEVNDHESEVQRTIHNTSSVREQMDQLVGNESPRLAGSLKTFETAGNKRGRPRRRPNVSAGAADSQSLPTDRTLRGRKRILPAAPSGTDGLPVTALSNLSSRVLRPRPVRSSVAVTGNSAKPRAVSKRKRA